MSPTGLRERAEHLEDLLTKQDVIEAMRERCEEQGHEYENCCSLMFQIYQRCKWCGSER